MNTDFVWLAVQLLNMAEHQKVQPRTLEGMVTKLEESRGALWFADFLYIEAKMWCYPEPQGFFNTPDMIRLQYLENMRRHFRYCYGPEQYWSANVDNYIEILRGIARGTTKPKFRQFVRDALEDYEENNTDINKMFCLRKKYCWDGVTDDQKKQLRKSWDRWNIAEVVFNLFGCRTGQLLNERIDHERTAIPHPGTDGQTVCY